MEMHASKGGGMKESWPHTQNKGGITYQTYNKTVMSQERPYREKLKTIIKTVIWKRRYFGIFNIPLKNPLFWLTDHGKIREFINGQVLLSWDRFKVFFQGIFISVCLYVCVNLFASNSTANQIVELKYCETNE